MHSSSLSTSDFKFELSRSVQLPEGTCFYISELSVPNAWYSIEQGLNDHFYFMHKRGDSEWVQTAIILTDGIYNGFTFATNIQSLLSSMYVTASPDFNVSYDESTNTLKILASEGVMFRIPSDEELLGKIPTTQPWQASNLSGDYTNSINGILRNHGISQQHDHDYMYESGFLNFFNFNTLYLSSNDLGNFQVIGPNGSENIIKKIAVNESFGFQVRDANVLPYDYLSCSKQTLRTMSFRLHDVYGRTIPLHGSNINFSNIFTMAESD